ncbi:MAG: hypothetical protein NTZ74_00495 [Chloroflexi bacterium]|nr:hypothetical protein [Chloroflexota bacterium]
MTDPRANVDHAVSFDFVVRRSGPDFSKVQLAPSVHHQEDDFRSLRTSEKQALLQKLIERVKAI